MHHKFPQVKNVKRESQYSPTESSHKEVAE